MATHCDWQALSRHFLMQHAARGDRRASEILRGLLLSEQMHDQSISETGARVAIGVCTAMRPRILAHCLEAIGAQITPPQVELHVVVADNEPEPNNSGLVQDFSARYPSVTVHYVHEARRGIPQARNAVVEKCRSLDVDWIAFTDDDCWVSPMWLASLLSSAARYNADVIYGRREYVAPSPSPFWGMRPVRSRYVEGEALRYASTHNVLFAASLVRDGDGPGLRFDESLPHGEDTDFFYRAVQRGARIVYSGEPIVFELVPRERATLNYQVRRAYYFGASRSKFHRRHSGVAGAMWQLAGRCLFKAPVAVVRLLAAPFLWPFSEPAFKFHIVKGTAALAGVAGAWAGLLGLVGNPYQTIDRP